MFGLSKREKIEKDLKCYTIYDTHGGKNGEQLTIDVVPFACKYADNNSLGVVLYTTKRKFYKTLTVNLGEDSKVLGSDCAYTIPYSYAGHFVTSNKLGTYLDLSNPLRYEIEDEYTKQPVQKNFFAIRFDLSKINTFEQLHDWLNIDRDKLIDLNTNKGV